MPFVDLLDPVLRMDQLKPARLRLREEVVPDPFRTASFMVASDDEYDCIMSELYKREVFEAEVPEQCVSHL